MVVILIFIMATINLGDLSLTAEKISNAADAATLYLVSELASVSTSIGNTLEANGCGRDECKQKKSFVELLVAIIAAIILTIATYGTGLEPGIALVIVVLGTTATTFIAGGIHYGTWDGALQGAMTGLVVGAMIGTCVYGTVGGAGETVGALGGVASQETFYVGATGPGLALAGQAVPAGSLILDGAVAYPTISGILTTALGVGGAVLDKQMEMDSLAAGTASVAKMFNSMDQRTGLSQGAMYQAFLRTVDDPRTVPDDYDIDADGDVAEKIPAFQVWWYKRESNILSNNTIPVSLTSAFLNKMGFSQGKFFNWSGEYLYKLEAKHSLGDFNLSLTSDGWLVAILRSLWNHGETSGISQFKPSFWNPGEQNTSNPHFDEVQALYDQFLLDLNHPYPLYMGARKDTDSAIAKSYLTWIGFYYDASGDGDLYDVYNAFIEGETTPDYSYIGMKKWIDDLERIKHLTWSVCQLGSLNASGGCDACSDPGGCSKNCAVNPPCVAYITGYVPDGPLGGGIEPPVPERTVYTTDSDLQDEMIEAKDIINEIILELGPGAPPQEGYRQVIKYYYDHMEEFNKGLGGNYEKATYAWPHPDCPSNNPNCQKVTVEVIMPSGFPSVNDFKNKNDWGLTTEYGVRRVYASGNCGVAITREIPINKETNTIMGIWRPMSYWSPWQKTITIKRSQRAKWGDYYLSIY